MIRSEEYLEFIRSRPCATCTRRETVAHHWRTGTDGGTGLKPSDCYALPLCDRCHREAHQYGERTFAAQHRFEPLERMTVYLAEFLMARKGWTAREIKALAEAVLATKTTEGESDE